MVLVGLAMLRCCCGCCCCVYFNSQTKRADLSNEKVANADRKQQLMKLERDVIMIEVERN